MIIANHNHNHKYLVPIIVMNLDLTLVPVTTKSNLDPHKLMGLKRKRQNVRNTPSKLEFL
jgi:hypothetical protein